jgi:hypothetical protein
VSNDKFTFGQQTYVPVNPIRICDGIPVGSQVVSNQCNDGTPSIRTLEPNSLIGINVSRTGPGVLNFMITNATAFVLNIIFTNTTKMENFEAYLQ